MRRLVLLTLTAALLAVALPAAAAPVLFEPLVDGHLALERRIPATRPPAERTATRPVAPAARPLVRPSRPLAPPVRPQPAPLRPVPTRPDPPTRPVAPTRPETRPPAAPAMRLACTGVVRDGTPAAICHWTPDRHPAFAAYVLLRSVDGGPPATVHRSDDQAGTTYRDGDVRPGQKIVYLVQSVDRRGQVLTTSNRAPALVPHPARPGTPAGR